MLPSPDAPRAQDPRILAPALVLLLSLGVTAQDERPPDLVQGDVTKFFAANCVRCHGTDKVKGDITLHDLRSDPAAGGEDALRWELVLEMLEGSEMPPEEEPQPDAAVRASVVDWIDVRLRQHVEAAEAPPVPPTTRRLTNAEYVHTMRDLLGVDLDLSDALPEDPTRPYHFNNSAEYMLLGLEQIDRYEAAARRALKAAIVDPAPPEIHKTRKGWGPKHQRGMPDPSAMQSDELGIFGNRNRTVHNGMRVFEWPETGEFRVRVQASAILPPGHDEVPLCLMMGHNIRYGSSPAAESEPVGTVRVTNTVDDPQVYEFRGRIGDFPWQPRHQYRRGGKITGALVVTPPHYSLVPVNVFDDGTLNDKPDPLTKPRLVVEWMEFEAPVFDAWPPAHHRAILFDSPLRDSDPAAYVREVLARFLPRAFRRPVTEDEVDRYSQIYDIVSDQLGLDTIEDAMRETLTMALISPDFLFRTDMAGDFDPQYALASRLSYFLWGSTPDAALLALAAEGSLREPAIVDAQVRRLLADARSKDFVEDFTTQWFAIDKMLSIPIDLERFPRFLYTIDRGEMKGREHRHRPTIRESMREETIAFIGELIRRNASLLGIVDSDFAMLNQPLAAHYGVEGVQGHELRAVPIDADHHLGGVLTQGSFLIGNSTGSAPHPVYRAVWLREAILGDHVGDPPADVPALEDSVGEEVAKQATSLKDLLAQHRTKESCRDCHARLDPWGIPFEEYDATGRFARLVPPAGTRVPRLTPNEFASLEAYKARLGQIATVAVETDAKLPNGPEVDGVAELKRYLLEERHEDIAENVTRRLLTYALGRELTVRDRYVVERLVRDSAENGYKLQDLIVSICGTELVQGRTDR